MNLPKAVAPPRHTSLEREFFASVPPTPTPLLRRAGWRVLLWLVALPPVVWLLRKRIQDKGKR
ncbi:MAG: hypothetical protein LBE59_00565 [Nevskiaceae bacterium]|jgi:hypothetical protein|nr:hypothetical protein [Nevskiaceae bacterium]